MKLPEIPKSAVDSLARSGVILLMAFVTRLLAINLVQKAVRRVDDDDPETTNDLEKRAQTLGGIVQSAADVGILLVAAVMILGEWGIEIAPILAGAGVMGLAIGFGAQTLVKDVVTGFFILLENQFNAGDTVQIAGLKGKVQEMKLRTTTLQGEDGEKHIIPNSQIVKVTKFTN